MRDKVLELLQERRLLDAVEVVDQVLVGAGEIVGADLEHIRVARSELARRRTLRATRAR